MIETRKRKAGAEAASEEPHSPVKQTPAQIMAKNKRRKFQTRHAWNKRTNKPKAAAIPQPEWYERIQSEADITEDDIMKAYKLSTDVCPRTQHSKKRQNCKENPNCLFGFGEGKEVIADLGPNPVDMKRDDSCFTGLKNLGATCYMNTLLQSLYMNTVFRQGVFDWKHGMEANEDDPGLQLQLLFAKLQLGNTKYLDPNAFTNAIKLKNNVQQDPTEFFKLFITLLEEKYSDTIGNLIQNQFQGKYKYVTTCHACNTQSTSPGVFYELELPIKGHSTLDECLKEYTQDEQLTEGNQYFCSKCDAKQDAARCCELSELPEVLNLQLMRFVYDVKTAKKKKLKSKIYFPFTLDMNSHFGQNGKKVEESKESKVENQEGGKEENSSEKPAIPSDPSLIYELSAVLVHKGVSATGGHYIAHIRDEITNTWWTFDDEKVVLLNDKSWNINEIDGEEEPSPSNGGKKKEKSEAPKGVIGSCNAYMLVYTRKGRKIVEDPQVQHFAVHTATKEREVLLEQIKSFEQKTNEEKARLREWREFYDKLSKMMHPKDKDDACAISVKWWTEFIKQTGKVAEIDNTPILCEHSKIDPNKVNLMKSISKNAFDFLHSKYKGGPQLNFDTSTCLTCIQKMCHDRNEKRANLETKKYYENLLTSTPVQEDGYWVSKAWIVEWRKTNNTPMESGLTDEIICEHDNLLPDESKRRLISADVWKYLSDIYEATPMPSSMEPCEQCAAMELEAEQKISKRKDERETEMAFLKEDLVDYPQIFKRILKEHQSLANGNHQNGANSSSENYFLIPTDWVKTWRTFIEDPTIDEDPTPLDNNRLVCEHHQLKYDPNEAEESKKSENPMNPAFVLITENSWQYLKDRYKGAPDIRCSALPLSPTEFMFQAVLPLCDNCMKEQRRRDEEMRLTYDNADIFIVEKVKEPKEDSKDDEGFIEVKGRKRAPPVKSVWNNKNNYNTRSKNEKKPTKTKISGVNSSQTLQHLKLLIYQAMEIAPFQQNLYTSSGVLLEQDQLSLAQCNIAPGDVLSLEKREESDTFDEDVPSAYYREEGFEGTIFHSGSKSSDRKDSPVKIPSGDSDRNVKEKDDKWRCPQCTFDNPIDEDMCSMCELPRR